jgi:hypothetical protein
VILSSKRHAGFPCFAETRVAQALFACSITLAMGCFKRNGGDEDEKIRKEANKKIEKQLQKDKQLYRATHRLLLLGVYVGDC